MHQATHTYFNLKRKCLIWTFAPKILQNSLYWHNKNVWIFIPKIGCFYCWFLAGKIECFKMRVFGRFSWFSNNVLSSSEIIITCLLYSIGHFPCPNMVIVAYVSSISFENHAPNAFIKPFNGCRICTIIASRS